MALTAGVRLGPYEILAPLGAGGMGEVYRARDTRLDRTVAIKILPEALAHDPQFRERFDREARAISQLDHPHICALYDIGQENGTAYLVMPYLDGETLAARLQKGALPLDQALEYAVQIAEALARAHRAGIVHRDLKPGNVMLTRTGARLLDFGLAKTGGTRPTATGLASLPTTPAGLTLQGTIVGTFPYMAPEQIEGAEADTRSDIWAFGCVLYEMLTGKRAFDGKSHASLMASILHAEPPSLAQQSHVPRALDHIIRRCLAKDPDARWQSISDVGHELRWAAAGAADAPVTTGAWRRPLVVIAALLVVAGVSLTVALWRLLSAAEREGGEATPIALTLVAPRGLELTPIGSQGTPHFALSPDGRHIAFVASEAGQAPTLWIRPVQSRLAREIPESRDAASPFWSPDGQSVGFFSEGQLKTMGLQGERPRTLARIVDHSGGTWHGDVVLVGQGSGAVLRVPAAGGTAVEATVLRAGHGGHRWPQFLPGGRRFIYTESNGFVMIASLDSTVSTELLPSRSTAVYSPAAGLLYTEGTRLMAQPLDPASWTPTGSPREVLDQVHYVPGSGYPPVSVAGTELLAYWDGTTVSTELGWFDRSGHALPALPVPPGLERTVIRNHVISPDGRQVAFIRGGASQGVTVWLMDIASGDTSRFSFNPAGGTRPVWSQDGSSIAFTSQDGERVALFRRPVSGAAGEQHLGTVPFDGGGNLMGNFYASDWTRDGRTALMSLTQPTTGRDILAFSIDTGALTPLVAREHYEVQARLSPDNRWLAYASNETGRWEVFVEPFPPSGSRWQVSIEGGSQPVWRRDGKELFFLAPNRRLMAVSITPGNTFVRGTPRALFDTRMRPTYPPYPVNYDAMPDGERFLIDSAQSHTGPTISLVVNWAAGIRP